MFCGLHNYLKNLFSEFIKMRGPTTEAREMWPVLTVETQTMGTQKSTNERGLSFVGSLDSSCRYNWLWSCLGCSGQPSTQYFFLAYTISIYSMCLHRPAIWTGSRARPPVSECVSPGPIEYEAEGSKGEYVRSKELSCRLDKWKI
jgi:hypothetical protein